MDESAVSGIFSIVSNVTGVNESELSCDTSFEKLNVDAFDLEEILLNVEDEFDVFIMDSDDIHSVGDIVSAVSANR